MRTIYLVNPISGRGHLDSYARLYCRALVELGYEVVLIAETDGGTADYLQRSSPASRHLLSFVPFEDARHRPADVGCAVVATNSGRARLTAGQRARLVWQEEGFFGLATRCIRVPRRILIPYIPSGIRHRIRRLERRALHGLLRGRLAQVINLAAILDAGRILFQTLLGYVDNTVAMQGRSAPDLVFFLYLDLMGERRRNIAALDSPGTCPWVGILFHPRLARDPTSRIESYFTSRNARGGVFLVPAAIQAYAAAAPDLRFALAPDVADLECPDEESDVASEIKRRAAGRTIVLQIGSITAHKGIATLLDVIAMADPNRFFFALVGEVHWASFAEQEPRIRSELTQPRQNMLVHQGYVASERDYNDLVATCDIVYAVYRNFNSSSNSLTKAAGLRRPILVSRDSLMGTRVLASGIGAVAPETDPAAIVAELARLAARPKSSFSFERYAEEHSLEALKSVLAEALPGWLSAPKPELATETSAYRPPPIVA